MGAHKLSWEGREQTSMGKGFEVGGGVSREREASQKGEGVRILPSKGGFEKRRGGGPEGNLKIHQKKAETYPQKNTHQKNTQQERVSKGGERGGFGREEGRGLGRGGFGRERSERSPPFDLRLSPLPPPSLHPLPSTLKPPPPSKPSSLHPFKLRPPSPFEASLSPFEAPSPLRSPLLPSTLNHEAPRPPPFEAPFEGEAYGEEGLRKGGRGRGGLRKGNLLSEAPAPHHRSLHPPFAASPFNLEAPSPSPSKGSFEG